MSDLAPKCKLCGERHWGMCASDEPPITFPPADPSWGKIVGWAVNIPAKRKGRPRIEDKGKSFEATKPWVALGMSRRTWYSRRKENIEAREAADRGEFSGSFNTTEELMAHLRKEKEQGK